MAVVELFPTERHVMLLHASEAQRVDGLTAWVLRGLHRRDRVLCPGGSHEHDVDDLVTALSGGDRDTRQSLTAAVVEGRLVMPAAGDFYARGQLEPMHAQALAAGFTGVRFVGEAITALEVVGRAGYAGFEDDLDLVCEDEHVSAMCFYDERLAPRQVVVANLPAHAGGLRTDLFTLTDAGDGHLHLEGELDASNAELLREALASASARVPSGDSLHVKVSDGSFFDVAAVRALVLGTGAVRDRGGQVRLRVWCAPVRDLFALLGIERFAGVVVLDGTDR
jgi:anti-anti-sigma factor